MMGVNDRQRARRAFGYQIAGAILLWLQAGPALGSGLRERDLQPIAEIVTREVRLGNIPGAVVLIGHEGKVLYRRAFGYRALEPQRIPMTEDTIFDLASLTKVIATTTAVMQLVEQRRLRLEDSVARYWPEFGSRGRYPDTQSGERRTDDSASFGSRYGELVGTRLGTRRPICIQPG